MNDVFRHDEPAWPSGSLGGRWPAVLTGTVVAFALYLATSSFWVAWAGERPGGVIADNLGWWQLIDAVLAALVGGAIAGAGTRGRGAGSGFLSGVTMWGVLVFASLVVGVPTAVGGFAGGAADLLAQGADVLEEPTVRTDLWATFAAFAGGLLLAGLAGMVGASTAARRDERPQPGRHARRGERDGATSAVTGHQPFEDRTERTGVRVASPAAPPPDPRFAGPRTADDPDDHPRLP